MTLTQQQQTWLAAAIPAAQATQTEFGVPASVTLAQAILESGWGQFHLGTAQNYFGIKASAGTGSAVTFGSIATGFVTAPTREVVNGQNVTVQANFRAYASMTDSFRDHGSFLRSNTRYAAAFATTDGTAFARAVAAAGYATDPHYGDVLAQLIASQGLAQYDTPVAAQPTTPSPTAPVTTPVTPASGTSGSADSTGTTDGDSSTDATASGDTGDSSDTGDSTDTSDSADTSDSSETTDSTDTSDSSDTTSDPSDSSDSSDASGTSDTSDSTDSSDSTGSTGSSDSSDSSDDSADETADDPALQPAS